jgi:hypothetical protein
MHYSFSSALAAVPMHWRKWWGGVCMTRATVQYNALSQYNAFREVVGWRVCYSCSSAIAAKSMRCRKGWGGVDASTHTLAQQVLSISV